MKHMASPAPQPGPRAMTAPPAEAIKISTALTVMSVFNSAVNWPYLAYSDEQTKSHHTDGTGFTEQHRKSCHASGCDVSQSYPQEERHPGESEDPGQQDQRKTPPKTLLERANRRGIATGASKQEQALPDTESARLPPASKMKKIGNIPNWTD